MWYLNNAAKALNAVFSNCVNIITYRVDSEWVKWVGCVNHLQFYDHTYSVYTSHTSCEGVYVEQCGQNVVFWKLLVLVAHPV